MGVRVGRVTSKKLKHKPQNVKAKKANGYKRTARRSTLFKSASWYANAALSIGVSAKAETSAH
jgi:hypothetical protein